MELDVTRGIGAGIVTTLQIWIGENGTRISIGSMFILISISKHLQFISISSISDAVTVVRVATSATASFPVSSFPSGHSYGLEGSQK